MLSKEFEDIFHQAWGEFEKEFTETPAPKQSSGIGDKLPKADNDEEQKHLVAEGLTGEYVWAGSIGVYYDAVTSMEIIRD